MWSLEPSDLFASRLKHYQNKHRSACDATLENLDAYHKRLSDGFPPILIRASFIHPERNGVVAIDETGARGRQHATRLYVYVAVKNETLHLITIGDKQTQKRDLADCQKFMKEFRDGKAI